MNSAEGKLFVAKGAAAQRQLDAALRMHLSGENSLAIHTVAAAAFRILRDLKEKRGRGMLSEGLTLGMFAFAKDLADGKITDWPEALGSEIRPAIEQMAKDIASGQLKSADDLKLNVPPHMERGHWSKFNIPANFLKHSDNDDSASLSESDLDNETLLIQACVAYKVVLGRWTPEMFVFGQLWAAESNDPSLELTECSRDLVEADPETRRRMCLHVIQELKS